MNPFELILLFQENARLFLITLFLTIFLFFLFLLFGATAAGIFDVTMTKVCITAVSVIAAHWVVVVVFSAIPVVGGILGFMLGIWVMVYIIKIYFNTTWTIAIKVWVLAVLAEITVGVILKLYLGINVLSFIQQLLFVS